MMDGILKTENISFSYDGEDRVLSSVNIEIREGEFISILGSNGSGKSTLAKILDGLFDPDEGKFYFYGKEVKTKLFYDEKKHISLLFQNPDSFFVSPVLKDDIAFSLINFGFDENVINERVRAAIYKMGLQGKEDRNPFTLSGGEKQKAELAHLLALRPKVVIIDESLSMLDGISKQEFISVLKEMNRRDKVTVILITHDAENTVISDRVIIMDKGRIVENGKPRDIFALPDLKKYGIQPPCTTRLALKLIDKGVKFKFIPITPEEFGEALCE